MKVILSFFRFYYYVIIGSTKKYDIAMKRYESLYILIAPLFLFLIHIVISTISNLPSILMFLWIPILVANFLYVTHIRSKGYKKNREERDNRLREERDRQLRREREYHERVYREYIRRLQESMNNEQFKKPKPRPVNNNMANAMKLMGLNEGFSEKDLKSAYRRLSKIHHPDLGGLDRNFVKLNKAYNYILERI
jgi:hypothetical protein